MLREKSLPMVYGGLVFLLSACATAANGGMAEQQADGIEKFAGDPRLGEEVKSMCFASNVDSFSSPTDDTVILKIGVSKEYLVETSTCFDLDRAMSIALDTTSSCASRGDSLIVSDSVFGMDRSTAGSRPNRCMIRSIHVWNGDAAAPAESGR